MPTRGNRRVSSLLTLAQVRYVTPAQQWPPRRPRARSGASAVAIGASDAGSPETYVAKTRVAMIASGAACIQSRSRTAQAAFLPVEIEPVACSMKFARAAHIVIERNASSRVIRWFGYHPL